MPPVPQPVAPLVKLKSPRHTHISTGCGCGTEGGILDLPPKLTKSLFKNQQLDTVKQNKGNLNRLLNKLDNGPSHLNNFMK